MAQSTARFRPLARRWQVRLDHLYLILALVVAGVLIALVPMPPNDFWWHLRIGAQIAESGQIPSTNIFAWPLPADTPFVYGAWLGEWLFYLLYQIGHLELVIFARNLLVLGTFAVIGLEARHRSGSWRLAALAVGLALAMSLNNLIVRTQNWSWLPFALFVLILGRYTAGHWRPRALLALPLIMIFWVNAHGAFVVGIALIILVIIGETVRRLARQTTALSWPYLRKLVLAGGATLLATIINPQGLGIFGYVQTLLTDQPIQELIVEWQPPSPEGIANTSFFASILLLLVAFTYARRRPSLTDLLVICAFLWLAWSGQRSVVWFGLVAMPVLAQVLSTPRPQRLAPTYRRAGRLNNLLAVVLLLPLIAVQPWFVSALPLGEGYRNQVLPPPAPPLLAVETPLGAAAWLRQNPGGKLFNELGYGSFLIWAVPEQGVFIDPRIELFPQAQWEDYVDITRGRQPLVLLEKYGIDRVLLSKALQPKLATAMQQASGWQRTYSDQWSEIWVKQS